MLLSLHHNVLFKMMSSLFNGIFHRQIFFDFDQFYVVQKRALPPICFLLYTDYGFDGDDGDGF